MPRESVKARAVRKLRRYYTDATDCKDRRASPAIQFDWALEKDDKVKHLWGSFKAFDKSLIFHFDNIRLPEDEIPYGRCRFLRMMSVLPDERGKGLTKRFLKLCQLKADKTGCLLYAHAAPFELNWNWVDNKKDNFDKLKKTGEYLTESSIMLNTYYFWDNKIKEKRRRQKKRFLESGWQSINCNYDYYCEIERKKHARWTFCYIPRSIDQEFLKKIKHRLSKKKKG